MLSRGEKEMLFAANFAVGQAIWLRDFYDDFPNATQTKRVFSTIKTRLINTIGELAKKAGDRDDVVKLFEDFKYRTSNRVKGYSLSFTLDKDSECHKFFSRYAVIYIAIRDLVNYYEENPKKIDKKTMKDLKTIYTLINKIFRKHGKDADLPWEPIKYVLENKEDTYRFEGRVIYM